MPQLLKALPGCGRVTTLIVGIAHRDQTRIRRALHVVLSAKRMQSRAGLADLAGGKRQCDQATRVVGAVNMLRDPHAPEDHRAFRCRVQPRDLANRLGIDAADRRHQLRRKLLDVFGERFVTGGAVANERLVDQPLFDDDVQHRVEQRDIRIGIELEIVSGVARQIAAARVGHDQLHPRLRGVLDKRCGHRMIHRRIGADHENHFRVRDVAHRVRHRARVDAFHQRGHARSMAKPRAVVDVVRAEAGSHQLLEQYASSFVHLAEPKPASDRLP